MTVERDFCQSCGRRVLDASIAGICSICGKKLCQNCVRRGTDGRYYCIEDFDPGPPPEEDEQPSSSNCLFAIAASGTTLAIGLNAIRAFRDHTLVTNQLGQHVTAWYYRVSPYIATRIRHHPWRRLTVRCLTIPLVHVFQYLGY